MPPRMSHEQNAGPWVAWMERPRNGKTERSYLWRHPGTMPFGSWTSRAEDGVRYNTKAEALAAIRLARQGIQVRVRTGAERVESTNITEES